MGGSFSGKKSLLTEIFRNKLLTRVYVRAQTRRSTKNMKLYLPKQRTSSVAKAQTYRQTEIFRTVHCILSNILKMLAVTLLLQTQITSFI